MDTNKTFVKFPEHSYKKDHPSAKSSSNRSVTSETVPWELYSNKQACNTAQDSV